MTRTMYYIERQFPSGCWELAKAYSVEDYARRDFENIMRTSANYKYRLVVVTYPLEKVTHYYSPDQIEGEVK